jgi:hypothetical protein
VRRDWSLHLEGTLGALDGCITQVGSRDPHLTPCLLAIYISPSPPLHKSYVVPSWSSTYRPAFPLLLALLWEAWMNKGILTPMWA